MAVVTPTKRPKLVRNPCVFEGLVAFFVLSLCFPKLSVGVMVFVVGLSQISYITNIVVNLPLHSDNV